ncbi:MAG: hypothetical protein ACO3N7_08195 [Kiritimatiellia bacterium]
MKTPGGKRGGILILSGVLTLWISGYFHSGLIDLRRTRHLQQVDPDETTPLVALTTVAFGGFRGLVADALWIRANKMQEEGQYFEMVQLARWITQLEPRVPEVWSFQAWNLAYNISVLFPEFEDRWRWVNHGLDLLRKQGLTHNPNSPDLHWDIGWMFQHKIGMEFDTAHIVYKQKLVAQVEEILPEGRIPESGRTPELARALKDRFSMQAEDIQSLEDRYGPLDWRLPATHVLYWSTRGLTYHPDRFDERRLRRMRMQALGLLMRGGRMITLPGHESVWIKVPRLDLMDPVLGEYRSLLRDNPYNGYLRQGYTTFLNDALLMSIQYGNPNRAYELYTELAEVDKEIPPGQAAFQNHVQISLTQNPDTLSAEQASTRIVALLNQSMQTQDPIRARGLEQMAAQLHRIYQDSRIGEEHRVRTGLPSLELLKELVEKSRNP